jgi:RNA polymerase sigma-70 factor (ECF subfamily)
MERIAKGDRAAMDVLYHRYSPVVFALCQRIVLDRGTAEDLLVDVFFELWRKAERYDPSRGAPLTYITTLARSRAIDRKRVKSGRMQLVGDDNILEGELNRGGSGGRGSERERDARPDERAILSEQAAKVREAMGKLDEEYRKTLELSYFEGLSHSEIAARLGKPLGTVKTHIRMAVIRMRDLLRMDPYPG